MIRGRIDCCSNPFQIPGHWQKKGLRHLTAAALKRFPDLTKDHFICLTCRRSASLSPTTNNDDTGMLMENCISTDTILTLNTFESMEQQASDLSVHDKLPAINGALEMLGNSPIQKKRLKDSKFYVAKKIKKVVDNLKHDLGMANSTGDNLVQDFMEMLDQFKKEYHHNSTSYEKKIQILMALPKSWSISKMAESIGSTYHQAKVAKSIKAGERSFDEAIKRKGMINYLYNIIKYRRKHQ